MANLGKARWVALKGLLKYLKRYLDIGIFYKRRGEADSHVQGFVDSNYAGCLDTRKSMTGYIFTVHGGAVNWKSSLKKVVALSTTEAEYIASTEDVKEALWIKGFMSELSGGDRKVTLHCDSQNALFLMKNPMFHERTKHIDIRLHFIKDVISSGNVIVVKVLFEDNPTYTLSKPLSSTKFQHCLDFVQVKHLAEEL